MLKTHKEQNLQINKITKSLFIIFSGLFVLNEAYANKKIERKDFEVSVGQVKKQSQISMDGTITLSGTAGKGNTLNADEGRVNEILKSVEGNNGLNNKKLTKEEQDKIINEAFNGGNDTLIFEGGKKGSSKVQKISENNYKTSTYETKNNQKEWEDNSFQSGAMKSLGYGDFAKEVIIPTNFNMLNSALKQNPSMMPTSSPNTLPGLEMFGGVIDESQLRSALKIIDKASKRNNGAVNWREQNKNQSDKVSQQNNEEFVLKVNPVEEKWYDLLKRESQIMMLSGLPMKIMLVTSKDDLMYNFMISDVVKGKEELFKYKKFDDGIFSVLGYPLLNGKKVPMCYVVFDKLINEYNNKILSPLENKIGKIGAASLVIGHKVGICLDNLERDRKINTKNTWFSTNVAEIGLYAESFQALFPRGMRFNLYPLKERELMSSNAQRQYQQRVADGFSVLWAYNRGFKSSYDAYLDVKSYLPEYSTHYTTPALKEIGKKLVYMKTNTLTLSNIWKMARENQRKVGVENVLRISQADFNTLYNPQISELKQHKENNKLENTRLGNPMQNTKHMQQANHMSNTPHMNEQNKGLINTKNMSDTKRFEETKNNQLSQLNFVVKDLLVKKDQEEIKYNTIKEYVNGEKIEVENQSSTEENNEIDKLSFNANVSQEDIQKIKENSQQKPVKPVNFNDIKKGLLANNGKEISQPTNKNKENLKQTEAETSLNNTDLNLKNFESKDKKIKDGLRKEIIQEYKLELNLNNEKSNLSF